jgi:hypothetical protein
MVPEHCESPEELGHDSIPPSSKRKAMSEPPEQQMEQQSQTKRGRTNQEGPDLDRLDGPDAGSTPPADCN